MALFKRKPKPKPRPYCAAVVPAAGQGLRMGGDGKMLREIDGQPVIGHTLLALERCTHIDEIVIAARSEDILPISDLCKALGITKARRVIRGGETRAKSVLAALLECSEQCDVAAIHDGARPCVTPALIGAVVQKAAETGAAVPGIYMADTVKALNEFGQVTHTLDRSQMATVQTPQCFEPGLIKGALTKALRDKLPLTDDCSAVEALGMPVTMVPGDPCNIKVTTKEDLLLAEAILSQMRNLKKEHGFAIERGF